MPERVISLQPSMTEILFALGVGEKVVGVTTVDNYPEEVLEIEQVSDSWNGYACVMWLVDMIMGKKRSRTCR